MPVETRQKSNDVLVERLLPHTNGDPADRAVAWEEWYVNAGAASVLAFVRTQNDTPEPDADILQEAIAIAYAEVERGRYEPRANIPFTAYVKGIARNKIREARRRTRRLVPIEEAPPSLLESDATYLERAVERQEQLTQLRADLSRLPPCRRRVLQRYIQGQSTVEIARAMEMSEDAVRQHKCRALRSLRQMAA
jgi:RNA polymerase sigma factor (sigma-70 family)